jgi:hypothetical protein
MVRNSREIESRVYRVRRAWNCNCCQRDAILCVLVVVWFNRSNRIIPPPPTTSEGMSLSPAFFVESLSYTLIVVVCACSFVRLLVVRSVALVRVYVLARSCCFDDYWRIVSRIGVPILSVM